MASKLVILLLFAALQHSSQYPSPFSAFAPLYSLLNSKVDCADGVCDVKSQDRVRTSSSDSGSNENSSLNELVKMGWKEQEAKRALLDSKNDIETAAALLEREQEENEALEPLVQEIMNEGWGRDVSITALKQSQGNVTDALKMIEMEEKLIQEQFDKGVKDMLDNGWDEVIARQALLAQWGLDQRKAMGMNITRPSPEVIAALKPSLKRKNESRSQSSEDLNPLSDSSKAPPKPALKEDVVFDVNVNNFQKLVLESPVPVVLDIYADWCGPCKQLGPILENSAMKSGGIFRLCKVNSDQNRDLAEALEVSGLPTVYTVDKGKFNDKFVGMLPQDQLQQYLVRAVTGYGNRVQGDATSDGVFASLTQKLRQMAGLASITFKKKNKINVMVEEAIDMPGGLLEGTSWSLSKGVETALLYITNAARDIENEKVRTISTKSKAYVEHIMGNDAALKLLDIAGFKSKIITSKNGDTSSNNGEQVEGLQLSHSNSAILVLISQRVRDITRDRRFANLRSVDVPIHNTKSFRRPSTSSSSASTDTTSLKSKVKDMIGKNKVVKVSPSTDEEDDNDVEEDEDNGEGSEEEEEEQEREEDTNMNSNELKQVTVILRQNDAKKVMKGHFEMDASLGSVITKHLNDNDIQDWKQIELRYPLPRRLITPSSNELDTPLKDLIDTMNPSLQLVLINSSDKTTEKKSIRSTFKGLFTKKNERTRGKMKTFHDLRMETKIKDKKHNEYAGGEGTVTISGEEDDDDDDNDDDEDDTDDEIDEEESEE